MQIQGKLYNLGFYTDSIDGRWGKNSKAALSKFRASQGLSAYPLWDLETQKALLPNL
jgi:peptidoglycan hydrolase-like protein with peptidoglycan-binding domain